MKRIIMTLVNLTVAILSLTGCFLYANYRDSVNGELITLTITFRNATEHEIEAIMYDSPAQMGATSPIHVFLERGDETLKPEEERELAISIFENSITSGSMDASMLVDGEPSILQGNSISLHDVKIIEITLSEEMNLIFTKVDDNNDQDGE